MIERQHELNDGRVLNVHEFSEAIVEMSQNKVKYLTKSRESSTSPNHVVLYVEKTFTEWSQDLLNYDTALAEISAGEFKQYGVPEVITKTLEELKTDKTKEISTACGEWIIAGFYSSALGEPHLYPNKQLDQLNLNLNLQLTLTPNSPTTFNLVCADINNDWVNRPHTKEQVQQVALDANEHITNARLKYAALREQINDAANAAELEAITW